jgi:hypothetical protein
VFFKNSLTILFCSILATCPNHSRLVLTISVIMSDCLDQYTVLYIRVVYQNIEVCDRRNSVTWQQS